MYIYYLYTSLSYYNLSSLYPMETHNLTIGTGYHGGILG